MTKFIETLTKYLMALRENDLFGSVQSYLGGKFILAGATLAVGVITSRLLTPEDRGLYVLFFTIGGLIFSFLHIGLAPANIYFLNTKKTEMGVLIGNGFAYLLFAIVFLGASLVLFVGFDGQNLFRDQIGIEVWFMLWLIVLFNLADASFSALAMGTGDYNFIGRSLNLQATALLLSACIIPLAGTHLFSSLALRVLGASVFFLWFVVTILRILDYNKIKVCWLTLGDQLRFGSKNWLQNIIGFLNLRCYFIILAMYSEPDIVGFFSVAWIFVELLRFLPDGIGTMMLPELTKMKSNREQGMLAAKSMRLLLLIVLLTAAGLYLSLDFSIPLGFGEEYVPAITITKILLIGTIFGVVYQVFTRFFTSQNKQIYSLTSSLVGLFFGLISCLILTPNYDGEGSAIAFCIGAFSSGISTIFLFCYHTKIKIITLFNFKFSDFLLT